MKHSITLNLSREEATHLQAVVTLHVEKLRKRTKDPNYGDIAAVFQRSLEIEEGIMSKLERKK